MMPETEVKKVENLVEAARQRLVLAADPQASFFRVREHAAAADELLEQVTRVLRKAS
jgi:hypothetical protein